MKKLKIAIDFDGTIVDKDYSDEYLDKNNYENFIQNTQEHIIYIITARESIAIPFINKYSKIPTINIICCGNEKEKKLFLSKNYFDVIIDDNQEMLDASSALIKLNIQEVSWKDICFLFITEKPFSPGPVPQKVNFNISYSHRSNKFSQLWEETNNKVLKELHIKDKNLLFIQGSGTASIESVLSSLKKKDKIVIFSNGTFGDRASEIAKKYFKEVVVTNTNILNIIKQEQPNVFLYIQFETSKSIYNNMIGINKYCKDNNIITISDCVSSLGYYDIPNTDIVCSSSAKLLSGCPVMGLVLYNNENIFTENSSSFYFSIHRYIKSAKNKQTPHTSLIPQLETLNNNITNRVSIDEINNNCKQFTTTKLTIENEIQAPVLTFKGTEKQIQKLFEWFDIFKIEPYFNKVYMKDYFQLSMFSYKQAFIYKFINTIIEEIL